MSHTFEYSTLDVFTSSRFAGNPLAIVRVPKEHASLLTQERKQIIAREFNYSETVFLHEDDAASSQVQIDIFTTTIELPFAGHPTIGSACYFMHRLSTDSSIRRGKIITKSGPIPISYDPAQGVVTASIPHNVRIHARVLESSDLIQRQPNLAAHASIIATTFPVVSIVRGMTFALIELPNIEILAQVSLATASLPVDLDEGWAGSFVGSYFFVKESQVGNVVSLRTRMIEYLLEDPATGSAASTLAAFLSIDLKAPNTDHEYKIVQGVEMGRRSEIGVQVRTNQTGQGIDTISLIGQAVVISEGKLWV